jgi:ubiquinone/menaquinone biosynthesis C-methylase UbiE
VFGKIVRKAEYQKIAESYDKGRHMLENNVELWMGLISRYAGSRTGLRILDLGCGTGRFALPMAERLHYQVVGADSSEEMLEKARGKDTKGIVAWDIQDAQEMTYPDDSFDAVFITHLLHHVDSPLSVIKECRRILTNSGAIFIRYGAIEQIRDDVEHTFFPETLPIDEERTPTIKDTEQWLHNAGFTRVLTIESVQRTYESADAHLGAVKFKSTSVLNMIAPEAFTKGVHRLEEYVQEHPDDPWLLFDRFAFTIGYSTS